MKLLEYFVEVAKEIATDLEMDQGKLRIDHDETPHAGLDYTAELYEESKGFEFYLSTHTDDADPTIGEMKASLTINFAEGTAPYFFHESIDYIKAHPDFLGRWASWAVFNFRQQHRKIDLQSLFHEVDIRVYGIPGYCDPAEGEAELLFHGILATQKGKVLVYKFRHIDREGYLCRSVSYAVFVRPKHHHGFWVVFPDNCGSDSGGGRSAYRHFESLVEMTKQKLEVEVSKYDIKYEELETFLLKHSTGFFSVFRDSELNALAHYFGPSKALQGSEPQFEKFMERLGKRDYPQAMRDLRALVQQAQENVAKAEKLDYSTIHNPDIGKLASFMVAQKQLDGRLIPWFTMFTSVANLSSHRDFPTKQDMQDPLTQRRVLLTFHLGIYLLEELDEIVRPKPPH